jgi:hypothetical protein
MSFSPTLRRKALRAAVSAAGYRSISHWLEDRGFTRTHLDYVLCGKRSSSRLLNEIDAFILEQIPILAAELRDALASSPPDDSGSPAVTVLPLTSAH